MWRAQDAEKLEGWAKGLSGPTDLKPEASGDEVQQKLAGIAEKAAAGKFLYTKFFAIGLFRRACSAYMERLSPVLPMFLILRSES